MRIFYLFLILLGACSYNGHQNIAEQKVFFINPSDGDVVTSPAVSYTHLRAHETR